MQQTYIDVLVFIKLLLCLIIVQRALNDWLNGKLRVGELGVIVDNMVIITPLVDIVIPGYCVMVITSMIIVIDIPIIVG